MTNSKKLGMVVMAVLLGLSVAVFAAQDKESGDKAHWGTAAVRSNGDYDTDGGIASATLVTTGAATVGTTLEVTGVATLTSAPVFVAVTASGGATALLTNAPAITEETPTWITVTIGTNDYVIAAWDLD